jgi:hypothetical protein
MEYLGVFALMYLAVGAAFFAHPRDPADLHDFHWRGQLAIFKDTLPAVLSWPMAVWRMAQAR